MVSIQDQIECIILDTNITKSGKIKKLHLLLSNYQCDYLCDFDDTITNNRCLLYSKYNYLEKHGLNWGKLHKDFVINKKFQIFFKNKTASSIIIISSNNMLFIKEIIDKNKELFKKLGVNIVGIIGSMNGFKVTMNDKLGIIPKEKIYISDVMEYNSCRTLNNYICLDNYSILNYIRTIIIKMYYYLLFILKNA